jgi:N-acetylglucosaminyldiphosphoundecaprenol N-acetyl-beta-D-mannosaminyltransferase
MTTTETAQAPERVDVLGCPVDVLTMEQTVERCLALVERGGPAQHVVVNAAKLVAYNDDPRMAAIIRGCAIVNADGQAVVWGARMLGRPLPERVAGIDLMHELMDAAAQRGLGVYLLGAREQVLAQAVERLRERHPGLRVAGTHHGWFGDDESADVVDAIRAARPDLLFVAMSSPRKEYWLSEHLEATAVPFAMGVGGAFDVVAGLTRRAPRWMQRTGLEWLYRLLQEPRRLWRRYLVSNTRFALLLLRQLPSARR